MKLPSVSESSVFSLIGKLQEVMRFGIIQLLTGIQRYLTFTLRAILKQAGIEVDSFLDVSALSG